MPLANLYRQAQAPLEVFCQHGGETMTAVAVDLLTRPPEPVEVPEHGTLPELEPSAIEFIAETDSLLTMCSCSGSSNQPYMG
jgi:hypothetical protein